MAGFVGAALIALACFLLVTAEEWWPMGRQILILVLVFLALMLAVGGAQLYWVPI